MTYNLRRQIIMNRKILTLLLTFGLLGIISSLNIYSQSAAPKAEKKIVLYIAPMDFKEWSFKAKKDSMGMDYLPVYFEESAADKGKVVSFYSLKLNEDKKTAGLNAAYIGNKNLKAGKTIGFYGDPMGPVDFSSKPKKDSMGMDFVAVYID
jgi:membrane fusion protein, copper/silver efflux system